MEAHNEQFQELVTEIFGVLKAFESEIVAYRAAFASLLMHYDQGIAADVFQHALVSARHAHSTQKVGEKYAVELARFQELPEVPIGPKMQLLQELLQAIRSGDPRLYPSGESPLKDAQ